MSKKLMPGDLSNQSLDLEKESTDSYCTGVETAITISYNKSQEICIMQRKKGRI